MNRAAFRSALNSRSIIFQVMAPSLVLIVLGFLAVGAVAAWSRATSASEMFHRKVELASSLSQDIAATNLWEMDAEAVTHSLGPILRDPDMRMVLIIDNKGDTFFSSGSSRYRGLALQAIRRAGSSATPITLKVGEDVLSVAPLRHSENGVVQPLGDMVIVYDTHAVVAAGWAAVFWVFGVGAVVVGFVVALLFALTQRIARPLDGLSIAMAALSAGALETPVDNLDRKDEVGAMARAVQVFKDNALKLRRSESESARLLEARARAEAANRAKSEFLAHMSHELRTPLNGVLTMAQLMDRGELDCEQRAKLEVILRSGEGLLHVINDILDFSKIEAGKLELESIAFDASAVLEQVRASFAAVAEQKGLTLSLDIEPTAEGLRQGDPARLRQIVNNYVSNAIKFTSRGGVTLSLRGAGDGGGEGLVVAVRDTGLGIAPEGMPLLFEKFSQVDASTTRQFGGTGLGLAICRELATLMGGHTWAESTPGVGSTFFAAVALPRAARLQPEAPDQIAPVQVPAAVDASPLRLLAAEDNATNRAVLCAIMDAFNIQLELANNGREAVEAWERSAFDIILMDINMPVLDGMEATRIIRAAERDRGLRRTPIIALTANAFRHQIDEYVQMGMDGHLAKPIDIIALQQVLDRALSGAAQPDAATPISADRLA